MHTMRERSQLAPAESGPGEAPAAARRRALKEPRPECQELLAENAARTLRVGRDAVVLTCLTGELWVTIAGDPTDHVLAAGESILLGQRARVAMLALSAARVRIAIGASAAARAAPRTRTAWRRLTAALWGRRAVAP